MNQLAMLNADRITGLLVRADDSILDCMRVIDSGGAQVALVVDDFADSLIGVLTDGDLRRAILNGAGLHQSVRPFIGPSFQSVNEQTGRTEALDLMKCFSIEQLPIVDADGKVCGLHLLNELIRPEVLPNAAMILAGGRGTRLGALTRSIPKPMIPVAGRPILERMVLHLVGAGIREIHLSVGYLAEVIEQHFGDGSHFGCNISYLREDENQPLGTGGPLALLKGCDLEEPLLVINGDLIADFDVGQILHQHQRDQNAITLGVRTYSHSVPFGCVETVEGRVTNLVEKPTLMRMINAGIYVISPDVLATIPLQFLPMTTLIEDVLDREEPVGVFDIESWIDVGVPEQLAAARGL